MDKSDAAKLARAAKRIVIAKGKQVDEFSGGSAPADVVEKMLGPTGNLRAPTIRSGTTLLIGFNEAVFEAVFEDVFG